MSDREPAGDHSRAAQVERERLRRIIHDRALGTLEWLLAHWECRDAALRGRVAEDAAFLRAVLEEAAGESGDLSRRLRALGPAIASMGVTVEFALGELGAAELDAAATDALGDATREALVNVARHAGVPRAVVHGVQDDGGIVVTVRDNGCGFVPERAAGFGLHEGIVARVEAVGGCVHVSSAPGEGTAVTLWMPTLL